jgi:hypothetical protein
MPRNSQSRPTRQLTEPERELIKRTMCEFAGLGDWARIAKKTRTT